MQLTFKYQCRAARTFEGLAPKPLTEQAVQHLLGLFGLRKHFTPLKDTVPYSNVTDEMHGTFTDTITLGPRGCLYSTEHVTSQRTLDIPTG